MGAGVGISLPSSLGGRLITYKLPESILQAPVMKAIAFEGSLCQQSGKTIWSDFPRLCSFLSWPEAPSPSPRLTFSFSSQIDQPVQHVERRKDSKEKKPAKLFSPAKNY